jgi:hypothetical protein
MPFKTAFYFLTNSKHKILIKDSELFLYLRHNTMKNKKHHLKGFKKQIIFQVNAILCIKFKKMAYVSKSINRFSSNIKCSFSQIISYFTHLMVALLCQCHHTLLIHLSFNVNLIATHNKHRTMQHHRLIPLLLSLQSLISHELCHEWIMVVFK